jgi:hypothetical protein
MYEVYMKEVLGDESSSLFPNYETANEYFNHHLFDQDIICLELIDPFKKSSAWKNNKMTDFIISDLHLGHNNCIVKFTRPDGSPYVISKM